MIRYFLKIMKKNIAEKKYRAVIQNLKSGYFHRTVVLRTPNDDRRKVITWISKDTVLLRRQASETLNWLSNWSR